MLAHSDAELTFYLAGKLGTGAMTDGEESIVQDDLRGALMLEQGVPVSVGSGKSSLRYKLRATSHSVKLSCKSWYRTAECLRRTATWVGDLGECGVTKAKTNLKTLMGDWIVDADNRCEALGETFDTADQEYLTSPP